MPEWSYEAFSEKLADAERRMQRLKLTKDILDKSATTDDKTELKLINVNEHVHFVEKMRPRKVLNCF